MVKRGWLFGRLFSLYLIVYGYFDYDRIHPETPKDFGNLQATNISLVMVALGAGFLVMRTLHHRLPG